MVHLRPGKARCVFDRYPGESINSLKFSFLHAIDKLRLQRKGRSKPIYHIVAADARLLPATPFHRKNRHLQSTLLYQLLLISTEEPVLTELLVLNLLILFAQF